MSARRRSQDRWSPGPKSMPNNWDDDRAHDHEGDRFGKNGGPSYHEYPERDRGPDVDYDREKATKRMARGHSRTPSPPRPSRPGYHARLPPYLSSGPPPMPWSVDARHSPSPGRPSSYYDTGFLAKVPPPHSPQRESPSPPRRPSPPLRRPRSPSPRRRSPAPLPRPRSPQSRRSPSPRSRQSPQRWPPARKSLSPRQADYHMELLRSFVDRGLPADIPPLLPPLSTQPPPRRRESRGYSRDRSLSGPPPRRIEGRLSNARGSPRRPAPSPQRRPVSPMRRSVSGRRRSVSPRRRSPSPRRRTPSPRRRSPSPRRRSPSLRRGSLPSRRRSFPRRSPSPRRRSPSPWRRSPSSRRRPLSPRQILPPPDPKRHRKNDQTEEKLPTVFLANLPKRVQSEADLDKMFNSIGHVARVNLLTKRNNRIAFVSFYEMAHAQRAVHEMNGKRFGGDELPLKVELSHQSLLMEGAKPPPVKVIQPRINKDHDNVVRLANIPTKWREEDVRDWCDYYGMIIAMEIKTRGGQRHGKRRGRDRSAHMAYVQFSKASEAKACAEGMHHKSVQNRTIRAYVGEVPAGSAMNDEIDGATNRCVNCRHLGHKMKECDKSFNCFLCGQSGHVAIYCRHWKVVQNQTKCLFCGKDHPLMDCPNDFVCATCTQRGHLAQFCRATACHNCGDPTHKYNQCPRPMFCMNCGSRQHTRNICQLPAAQSSTVVCTMSAQEATEEYIMKIFGQFGKVVQVRQNRRPTVTHGFAYFSGKKMEKHAAKACRKVSKRDINGHMLTVEPATSTSAMKENSIAIFVGNIPVSSTEDQMKELFQKYKSFDEIKIHRSNMVVEVVYEDNPAAMKACLMLQGTEWGGPPLNVELRRDALPPKLPAKRKRSRSSSSSGSSRSSSSNSSHSSSSRSYSRSSSSSSSSRPSRRRKRSRRSRRSRRKSRDSSRSHSERSRSKQKSRQSSRSRSRSHDPKDTKSIKGSRAEGKTSDDAVDPEDRPLPPGWTSAIDPATNVPYYIHIESRTSSWIFPTSSDPPPEAKPSTNAAGESA